MSIKLLAILIGLILSSMNSAFAINNDERIRDDEITQQQLSWTSLIDPNAVLKEALSASSTIPTFQENTFVAFNKPETMHPNWQWYPQLYGYQRMSSDVRFNWGIINIEKFDIFTVKMTPIQPNGKLVIFVHGYLDHTGNYTNFYDELLRKGITVVVFDLPGHGLSSGERASIKSFDIYARIVSDFIQRFGKNYEEVIPVGFSAGGAAILQAKKMGLIEPQMRSVLVAPLVRIKHYWIAEPAFIQALSLKYDFGWTFLDSVLSPQRRKTVITHDLDFREVLERDPIAPQIIPEQWTVSYLDYANQVEEWVQSMTEQELAQFGPMLLLQGDDDNVVDQDKGVELISNFPKAKIKWISGGQHALLNEGFIQGTDLLPEIFDSIVTFLN